MQTQVPLPVTSPEKSKHTYLPTYDRHIVVSPGVRSGKPRISGRRITVADIATWVLQQNQSVNDLVQEYNLTPAQIYAALTYYYDHRAEIDQREAEDLAAAEALWQRFPSKLQAKLISYAIHHH